DDDGDGVLDAADRCPDEPGVAPDGCPIPDTDGDGILDPDDQCVSQPELFNGYEDEDGCPDEIPSRLARFTGAIRGVHFDADGDAGSGKAWRPSKTHPPAPPSGSTAVTSASAVQSVARPPASQETYAYTEENPFVAVADDPVSTFSSDVDTASYANVRRFLRSGQLPPAAAVRVEELLNYFDYDYPTPTGDERFAVHTEVSSCPWNRAHRLVHIGIKGKVVTAKEVPPRNLVFLVDVSGSMGSADKLPLLKHGLTRLARTLNAADRVSIVVYAGAAGVVLPPTSGAETGLIVSALSRLEAGGSTAGGEGIALAYKLAKESFIKGGINRVLLASDGDFNVGVSSVGELTRQIERARESGVFLTTLGFGTGNYRDDMMESLADKGNGSYAYIDSTREAERALVQQANATLVTIAKDLKLQVEFNPSRVQGYRLIGYENRQLADQDFADDRKDAGDIGSGHTVTALYEIVPVGADAPVASTATPRRYQGVSAPTPHARGDELLQLKIRSKAPNGSTSVARSFIVHDRAVALSRSSNAFRFAAAVAEYGMLLRGAPTSARASFKQARELAGGSLGADPHGARKEFLELLDAAEQLQDQQAARTAWQSDWQKRWSRSKAVRRASVLQPSAFPVIERAAVMLREYPSISVEISGHTDSREGRSAEEAYAIAHARAETVRAYLIEQHGVDPTRLVTRAAGRDEPIASNETKDGRAKNRRIEFTIVSQ
ncbi:MAG: von Willebrand factor type A domain-containing protein, partial [Myxococcales bacterium]|nr:von Willebrand factor type A domain-containing protein [Myxococcales bacterium]